MISLQTILLLIWIHAVADFILQTDRMAVNKSNSIRWLTLHVLTYTAPFVIFGWLFALVNGVLHWITDFVTSRISSSFNQRGMKKAFFVTIGVDQAIHLTTLFVTYNWLLVVN